MGLPLFVIRGVSCPACHQESAVRYPNPKLYQATRRESDLHVVQYTWSVSNGKGIFPHHYDIWQCPHCLFADLANHVEQSERTVKDHHLALAWKKVDGPQLEVLTQLREFVDPENLDSDGAMALHVAALLVGSLPLPDFVDHEKLGRIALRLGWLFRERHGGLVTKADESRVDSLHAGIEDLESHLLGAEGSLDSIGSLIQARIEGGHNSGVAAGKALEAVSASLGDKLKEMRTLMTMLQNAIVREEEKRAMASLTQASGMEKIGKALLKVRKQWPKLPVNEADCIRLAVNKLEYAYNEGNSRNSIEHTLTMLSLILDLLMRIGENERALKLVAEIYNTGMDKRRELTKRIDEGKRRRRMSAHDEKMLQRKIDIVQMSIQRAGEIRLQILDLLHNEHRDTIAEILNSTAELPNEGKVAALTAGGIPEQLVTYLKARSLLTPDSQINSNS